MKIHCRAKMEHTKESIETLFKVKSHTYEKKKIVTRLVIGGAFVIVGLLMDASFAVQAVFLMIGAWLLVSKDFASGQKAEETVRTRNGALPRLQYQFWESGFEVEDGSSVKIKYKALDRLVEDAGYFYLFENNTSVCMIDKKTLQGMRLDELLKHIEEKSGKEFETEKSFLSMNLKDLLQMRKRKQ